MKTSRAQVDQNRALLLKAASEGFRKHGFDGLKVADIMRGAGLTHGGFYSYFASKDDLMAQACDASLKRQADRLKAAKGGDTKTELTAYFERYLSQTNRDHPDQACLFPSLATEVSRQSEPLRQIFTEGLKDYLEALEGLGESKLPATQNAIATLSTLVGAMVLARAVDDKDFSDEILAQAKAALKAQNGIADG